MKRQKATPDSRRFSGRRKAGAIGLGGGLAVTFFLLAVSRAESLPANFGKPEAEIKITVVPGKMKYDTESFVVKPNAKVKLALENKDEMQHNLVICRPAPDSGMSVAQAAWAMGETALKKQFVPEIPAVLFHTALVDPGKNDVIYFTAPTAEGDYPFVCTLPGHAFTMKGVMSVSNRKIEKRPLVLQQIKFRYFASKISSLAELEQLRPTSEGAIQGKVFTIAPAHPTGPFGIAFSGKLIAPADGAYTFRMTAVEGADLAVDGKQVVTGQRAEQSGVATLTQGEHDLVLRFFTGETDRVLEASVTGEASGRTVLTAAIPQRELIAVTDEPRVVRVLLPDTATASMAVGLVGGLNYCFDTENCAVRYVWQGPFLDTGPNTNIRGGQVCDVLGARVGVGYTEFPLRIGANEKPVVRFGGYRIHPAPEMFYTVGGTEVTETVSAGPKTAADSPAVMFSFSVRNAPGPVRFVAKTDGLQLLSSAGSFAGGVLTLSPAEAAHFSVTVIPQTKSAVVTAARLP